MGGQEDDAGRRLCWGMVVQLSIYPVIGGMEYARESNQHEVVTEFNEHS